MTETRSKSGLHSKRTHLVCVNCCTFDRHNGDDGDFLMSCADRRNKQAPESQEDNADAGASNYVADDDEAVVRKDVIFSEGDFCTYYT